MRGWWAALAALAVLLGGGASPGAERDGDAELVGSAVADLARAVTALTGQAILTAQGTATNEGTRFAQGPQARSIWDWPLPGRPEVVHRFDPPDQRWLPGHRGIDLAGFATMPVLAVADGTVTYSGRIAGVGIVAITHEDGLRSTYQPVTDRIERGTSVRAGDRIGLLGDFGGHCLLRTCLHLGAVRGKDHYLDPLLLLHEWELSLLPHDG